MKIRIFLLLALALSLFHFSSLARAAGYYSSSPDFLSTQEKQILEEMNFARTQPRRYVESRLETYRNKMRKENGQWYYLRSNNVRVILQEGTEAVDEAIHFMSYVDPMGALSASEAISKASRDFVNDSGPLGIVGHYDSKNRSPFDRMGDYGRILGEASENIAYGSDGPEEMVVGLIVDFGVPNRGHRHTIFNPGLHLAGLACGPHASTYRVMCVQDFAGDFEPK